MANKSKPKFQLKQRVELPPTVAFDAAGTVARIEQSVFAEPRYYVLPETGCNGPIAAQWVTEGALLIANAPPIPMNGDQPSINPKARTQLRARRKSKR